MPRFAVSHRLSIVLLAVATALVVRADHASAEGPARGNNGGEPPAVRSGAHDSKRASADRIADGGAPSNDGGARDDAPVDLLSAGTAQLIRAADFPPPKVLDHFELEQRESCRTYRKWSYLVRQKRRWLEAIRTLARTHPDYLYGWITGARRPPKRVRRIVLQQRNCLIDDMYRRAARPRARLWIEVELDDELIVSRGRLRALADAYVDGGDVRFQLRRGLTQSHYRSARVQAKIWRRKTVFEGSHFNRVTERAARKCGLPPGTSWKPELDRHQRCWERTLAPEDREREILAASAAPGLSRHHWGTEVDLFGLAPHHFRQGRRRWDEYQWMSQHALAYGFFQSYGDGSGTYVEERWHWSYYPVSHALTTFADNHRREIRARLEQLWSRIENHYNQHGARPPVSFDYVRENWERYMFDVSVPPVGGEPRSRALSQTE